MSVRKYTRELLEPVVQESVSYADVIRKLGLKQTGGTQSLIKKRIQEYEIETSHFLGKGSNCGRTHKGGPDKKPWQEVLVIRTSDRREESYRLRRALIDSGQEYRCEGEDCPTDGPSWRGIELRIQVEHVNGDYRDCRKENLKFLCPNCHSQTKTYSNSKGLTSVTSRSLWYKEFRKRTSGGMADAPA